MVFFITFRRNIVLSRRAVFLRRYFTRQGQMLVSTKSKLCKKSVTDKNVVLGGRALTWRCAGEGELLFAFIHCSPILPDLAEGVNRQILPNCLRVNVAFDDEVGVGRNGFQFGQNVFVTRSAN